MYSLIVTKLGVIELLVGATTAVPYLELIPITADNSDE